MPATIATARLWLLISLRALGRRILGIWGMAAMALVSTLFFLVNNQLTQTQTLGAARLGGLAASLLVIGTAAGVLVKRQPPVPVSPTFVPF